MLAALCGEGKVLVQQSCCFSSQSFFWPNTSVFSGQKTLRPLLSHRASLPVASSCSYITNGLMMAEEDIPDLLNPMGILSLAPTGPRNYLKAFSPRGLFNGPAAVLGLFLRGRHLSSPTTIRAAALTDRTLSTS